jgi:hypothetical protein
MIRKLTEDLHNFVKERNWLQFHTPRNMAMTLIVESFELLEHFLPGVEKNKQELKSEIGDVMSCILLTRECLGLNKIDELSEIKNIENPISEFSKKLQKFSEHFLWLKENQSFHGQLIELDQQLSDLLKLHHAICVNEGIDPIEATYEKLEKNKKRYPSELMKNSLESYFIRKNELKKSSI